MAYREMKDKYYPRENENKRGAAYHTRSTGDILFSEELADNASRAAGDTGSILRNGPTTSPEDESQC